MTSTPAAKKTYENDPGSGLLFFEDAAASGDPVLSGHAKTPAGENIVLAAWYQELQGKKNLYAVSIAAPGSPKLRAPDAGARMDRKPGTGTLYPEEQKTNPKGPDVTGFIVTPTGVTYRLAGWFRTGGRKEFYSLKLTIPTPREQREADTPPGEPT